MRLKQIKGQKAEIEARRYCSSLGYRFITKNYRLSTGEIDLIFQDGQELVFIEVKRRDQVHFGSPQVAVDSKKLKKIMHTAEIFMNTHPKLPQSGRVDVIAINHSQNPPLEHLINVSI